MVRLDSTLTSALGISPKATWTEAVLAALGQAGVTVTHDDLPDEAIRPVMSMLEDLSTCMWDDNQVSVSDRAEWATREALRRVQPVAAVGLLVVFAPHRRCPAMAIKDLGPWALRELKGPLTAFAGGVLRAWAETGLIIDIDQKRPA